MLVGIWKRRLLESRRAHRWIITIFNATGRTLDILGEEFLPRSVDENDEMYRFALVSHIALELAKSSKNRFYKIDHYARLLGTKRWKWKGSFVGTTIREDISEPDAALYERLEDIVRKWFDENVPRVVIP